MKMQRGVLIGIAATLFVLSCASSPSQGLSKIVQVSEDEYWYTQIDFSSGDSMDVRYTMIVLSGPYIDVFFMDHWNFQKYKAGNLFYVVPALTSIKTKSANLKSTLTTHGTYYLVFDNTYVETLPPSDNVDDIARISYTLDYNQINAQSIFFGSMIFIVIYIILAMIIIAIFIIHKKSSRNVGSTTFQYSAPQYRPTPQQYSPPPIQLQAPPIPPQQPPYQPPPQQYPLQQPSLCPRPQPPQSQYPPKP